MAYTVKESSLTINNQKIDDHILKIGDVINGTITKTGMKFAVRVDALDKSYSYYQKYSIEGKNSIKIGGGADCDIQIRDDFVSKLHAALRVENGEVFLYDSSTNGTYVCGCRVDGARKLNMLDDIYIVGVKLVFMGKYAPSCRAIKPFCGTEMLISRIFSPFVWV